VFGVTAANAAAAPTATLFYHTSDPLTYDVRWEIVGWHTTQREVVLKQEIRDKSSGTHTVIAKIGTEPLKFDFPK